MSQIEQGFLQRVLPLWIAGRLCHILTLTISAGLQRFDRTMEEAAFNLGASRMREGATGVLVLLLQW